MAPNPFLSAFGYWLGGLASTTSLIALRGIKRWSFETYWLVQSITAWLLLPAIASFILVPETFTLLHTVALETIAWVILAGMVWGVSALCLGLAVRYLGLALGYCAVTGCSLATGVAVLSFFRKTSTVFPIYSTQRTVFTLVVLFCSLVMVWCTAMWANKEMTEADREDAGERDFHVTKGMLSALVAGLTNLALLGAYLVAAPLHHQTIVALQVSHRNTMWQWMPCSVLFFIGVFLTNAVAASYLLKKHSKLDELLGQPGRNPMRVAPLSGTTIAGFDFTDPTILKLSSGAVTANYLLASLAGLIWFLQVLFYQYGALYGGQHGWAAQAGFALLFATLYSIVLKEWRGTRTKTRLLMAASLLGVAVGILLLGCPSLT